MRDQLSEAVIDAVTVSNPAPSNEQETCFRIIDPLLKAMGYSVHEIKIQDRDSAKQKPDYSILPATPDFTWFLEAKAWDVTLADVHANQGVNYANTQGKRWVVLSNGREWRLYDNHIVGTVEVKLACVARLGEEGFLSFLDALSKTSILQGRLEGYVRNQRLYSRLASQISRPDSDVIKAIVKSLKGEPGLSSVTAADIVGFFGDFLSTGESKTPEPAGNTENIDPATIPEPVSTRHANGPMQRLALASIGRNELINFKIQSVEFPNGQVIPISKWYMLTVQVAHYLMERGIMPTPPIYVSDRAKSPLVAREHSPESAPMRMPAHLPVPHNNWLVESHFSAADHRSKSAFLLSKAGIDPMSIYVSVYPGQQPPTQECSAE